MRAARAEREADLQHIVEQEACTKEEERRRAELLEKMLKQSGKLQANGEQRQIPQIRLEKDLLDELRLKSKQLKASQPSEELNGLLYGELDKEDEEWVPPSSDEENGNSEFDSEDEMRPKRPAAAPAAQPTAMVEVSEYEEVLTDDDQEPARSVQPSTVGGLPIAKPLSVIPK